CGCGGGWAGDCGPETGLVERAIDGDTLELSGGERVRYLLVDAPEIHGRFAECFGAEALRYNSDLVAGRTVQLSYDRTCRDRFDRLLAYVAVDGAEVNRLLVERGYACFRESSTEDNEHEARYAAAQARAKAEGRGMWAACEENPCR
ncbi:MAG: thermonuclease family protein, partial [Pseudomonadota bacterium]